jgi:DNA ligase (NAD+)
MTKEEARLRIEGLKKIINHHRYLYHVLDKQEISDEALDSLKKELFDLEMQYPDLITSDSPTQRVAGKPLNKFEKTKHLKPMLSFNDAFSQQDMNDWLERISKLLTEEEKRKIDFYCELKIDGLAIELVYDKGIFTMGSTRGDGAVGENVTQNLKTVEAIPLEINLSDIGGNIPRSLGEWGGKGNDSLIVRGEVFISKKEFKKANEEQQKSGLSAYANPRNLAAGSIRQLDSKIAANRHLDSFAYEVVTDFGLETHEEKHKLLKDLGFKTNIYNKYCANMQEVFRFHEECRKIREKIPYEIDGIVVIVNSNRLFEKLGVVGKAPRGAIAYKFPVKQAITIVEDIKVQIGRTGALTPVARLKPVSVGGVVVSRATLHNQDEIKRLGVMIGDTVIVGRAGDVIPDIISVLPELRTGKEINFKMPSVCPVCGSKIVKPDQEIIYRCSNPECFAQKKEYFYHFVSKKAFDIRGLGPKIVNKLLEEGLVSDPSDLFELKEGDLLSLERFAEKSASKLIESIQSRKKINFSKFIYGLGIRNVGEETAFDLAEQFGNVEKLKVAKLDDFQIIKDIGPIVANSISNWFSKNSNLEFLNKLGKVGISIRYTPREIKNQKLQGKVFVVTGVLDGMSRDQVKEKIKSLGGETSESVSGNTDFLIAGLNPGSKYETAKKLGVSILNEEDFLKMIS